jgi:hypothetical protein
LSDRSVIGDPKLAFTSEFGNMRKIGASQRGLAPSIRMIPEQRTCI